MDVAKQYDDFQTTFGRLAKQRQYLNYGYSPRPYESLEDSQEQLCKEVFKLAEIKPDDRIVDVGFGSGEQDFLLARMYPFKQLIGFNISKEQVEGANQRAQTEKLSNRLIFHHGQAEDMSHIPADSVDKVLAIECAFYFERWRFYQEAARILKNGGYLVVADISFHERLRFIPERYDKYHRAGTLPQNRELWEPYFQTVSVRSINNYTWHGAQKSVYYILKHLPKYHYAELKSWLLMALSSQLAALGLCFHLLRYHLIVIKRVAPE